MLGIDAAQVAPEPDKLTAQVDAFMARWDKNGDGYPNLVEVGQSRSSLTLLDRDGDGKAFAAEYQQFLNRGVGKPNDYQLLVPLGDALMPTFSAGRERRPAAKPARDRPRGGASQSGWGTTPNG